ncbi:MAG: helix-turn-helix domain-containing protein [Eubacterium sp.]
MEKIYKKSGYLNSEFKIFHLVDKKETSFDYHYHDFYKVLIFFSGNVSYSVEGREYNLCPRDIVLVNAGEIHRPVVHDDAPYERIIIYISPDFFETYKNENCDLFTCFYQSQKQHSNLIRLPEYAYEQLKSVITGLADSFHQNDFAAPLYQKIKLIEYLIVLNRIILNEQIDYIPAVTSNPTVLNIMKYINEHITDDLSIHHIAESVFLDRSYIMHLFKTETGFTIGKYITEKRLFLARHYIAEGLSITDACYHSGFKNYNSFYHAYKNKYGTSPKTAITPYL